MNPVTPASVPAANIPVSPNSQSAPGAAAGGANDGIGKLFNQLLEQANANQATSDDKIQQFVSNPESGNIQQVVLAVAKAEMSFQMFMEIRNKLIESYNELMRMQF